MENVYENVQKEVTPETAKKILDMMWEKINEPANMEKILAAKEEAGGGMSEIMAIVFPIIVDIQVEVVALFGFPRNKEGLREFLVKLTEMNPGDKERSAMLMKIRYLYLPPYSERHKGVM